MYRIEEGIEGEEPEKFILWFRTSNAHIKLEKYDTGAVSIGVFDNETDLVFARNISKEDQQALKEWL